MAAQLLCTGEFVESVIPQGIYAELRTAHNGYRRLVKERTRITNLIKGLLDGLFPEFVRVFKDPCGLTALSVLSACPIPGVIAGMTEEEFVAKIETRHHGRLMRKKLRALHHTAEASIGIAAGAQSLSTEISFLVEKLNLIERHISIIERTLVTLVDAEQVLAFVRCIRGLNYIAVAGLLAELGCFKAYRSAKQLIKMAGSNPTESESAGEKGPRTPIRWAGRRRLDFWELNRANPRTQHGAPALLAKPVCGMMGLRPRRMNPYLTAKLGAR